MTENAGAAANSGKGKPLSILSIVVAGMGILPVVLFFFSCVFARDWAGRPNPGLGHLMFFAIGFVVHGIALALGFAGFFMGSKAAGLIGIIGNAGILVMAVLSLLLGFVNI